MYKPLFLLLSYDSLSIKPILTFQILYFCLSVKQFDDIFNFKEIESKYTKQARDKTSFTFIYQYQKAQGKVGWLVGWLEQVDISNLLLRIGLSWFWSIKTLHILQLYPDGIPIWFRWMDGPE